MKLEFAGMKETSVLLLVIFVFFVRGSSSVSISRDSVLDVSIHERFMKEGAVWKLDVACCLMLDFLDRLSRMIPSLTSQTTSRLHPLTLSLLLRLDAALRNREAR